MLSGLAAVLAAAVSIYYLQKQIAQAAALDSARRVRRLAAARSRLQIALSDIVYYANSCILLLKQHLDAVNAEAETSDATIEQSRPPLPEPAILTLEAVIEATDDDRFAGILAETISQMQILNARLGTVAEEKRPLGVHNLHAYLMNAAIVHGYASGAFEYARRKTDDPPHSLAWANVHGALRLNRIYDEAYEELHAFIARAADRALGAAEEE